MGSDSSGLKPEQEGSAELTSSFGEATKAELGPQASLEPTEEIEITKEEDGVLDRASLGLTETKDMQEAIRDGLPSEGNTPIHNL